MSPAEEDPLGMRVAAPFVYRMHTAKEEFAMEGTVPQLSEQEPQILWREPRRSVRAVVDFRMIVADKTGLASGQMIDMTMRGCGLRLTKPLKPGQYLTLMVYPGVGPAAVPCDVGRVQWVEGDRAGLAFLSLSQENERRLRQLCGDRLGFED
jgi:hypothetical protein